MIDEAITELTDRLGSAPVACAVIADLVLATGAVHTTEDIDVHRALCHMSIA
ncbi:hypothetical protein KZ829_36755 [Actinoplanes hulinensis]|uniref:Uncharacterized protein n=1 Tax=Actinoplanes hulinensis TaxID=1144547 RepID=A0ABS7BEI5_9ACTN|nr:hypothetical protein [Actinoplanes hulinensis]MBW6439289.1 hypothetical protein [Actinoplanes hulinensis]